MRNYTIKQRDTLEELDCKLKRLSKAIDNIIDEGNSPFPINLVLEARLCSLQKAKINLEAEISFILIQDDFDESLLSIKQTLLNRINGSIQEIQRLIDSLYELSHFSGRGFEVVDAKKVL